MQLPVFLLVCLVAVSVYAQQTTVTFETTQQITDKTGVSIQINNTIPNAMIWASYDVVNATQFGSAQMSSGALELDYTAIPNGQDIYLMGFQSILNTTVLEFSNVQIVSYSTCSSQYSFGQSAQVDVGNKVGQWKWTYTDNTPFEGSVEYFVTLKVGAMSGQTTAGVPAVVDELPSQVVYFDFDLSSIGDSSVYDVTFSFSTTDPAGLSWLVGLTARYGDCPAFGPTSNIPLDAPNQVFLRATTDGKTLSVVLPNWPAKAGHFAVQTTPQGVGAQLSLTWTATGVPQSTADSSQGSSGGESPFWDTTTIVFVSVTGVLVAVVLVLAVLSGVLGYFVFRQRRNYTAI